MKTINKKTILAGLLAAAAMAPAEIGAFDWKFQKFFAAASRLLGIKAPTTTAAGASVTIANDPRPQFIADISAGNCPEDAIRNLARNHDAKYYLEIDSCYLHSWDGGIKNVGDPVIVKYSAHKFNTQEFGAQEVKSYPTLFATTTAEVTEYGLKDPKTEVSSSSKTPEFKTPRRFGWFAGNETFIGGRKTIDNRRMRILNCPGLHLDKNKNVYIDTWINRRPHEDEERENSHIKNILKSQFPEDKKQGVKPIVKE